MKTQLGPIALLGSGETSHLGGRIFELIAGGYQSPVKIAIVETPAGFELNSSQVAGRVADFLNVRLQNFQPVISVIPARKKNTSFSPNDINIATPIFDADIIYMGAGSPSFAVRQLENSLTWNAIRARHRLGASLVFSSAAVIAIGRRIIPVYEIYKVGEDISCPKGLDIFSDFSMRISVVPHWNNSDGGADVDTTRCFLGMERFARWTSMIPESEVILGIDEHTGIILDFSTMKGKIQGTGTVSLEVNDNTTVYHPGSIFALDIFGQISLPSEGEGIPKKIWEIVSTYNHSIAEESIPEEVLLLSNERKIAREKKDWKRADELRMKIAEFGWQIHDTVNGHELERMRKKATNKSTRNYKNP